MGITIYRNQRIGEIPPTPAISIVDESVTPDSIKALIEYGSMLGHPVSYLQEQDGRLIHNLVPVHKTEFQQISTSSKVELEMHTESSFHPYRPSYVLLLCLRGDEAVATTYANDFDIVPKLSQEAVSILQKEWFTTQIDQSFRADGQPDVDVRTAILERISQDVNSGWKITYDSWFMKAVGDGTDESRKQAELALLEMREAVNSSTNEVVLRTGDLLVINNDCTVHGRKPFQARYDGTDRWVQRMLVVREMPPPEHVNGHMIITEFN
jgi:alpha-ketoglutarate-dependent taurine dioxygenase